MVEMLYLLTLLTRPLVMITMGAGILVLLTYITEGAFAAALLGAILLIVGGAIGWVVETIGKGIKWLG